MASYNLTGKLVIVMLFIIGGLFSCSIEQPIFDENYNVIWGYENVVNDGSEVQIFLSNTSGGAGFESKRAYGSGFFSVGIKLPANDSGGVVTAYYLSSGDHNQDELDFEFLGNRENKPITLQTNVFVNGVGGREHRIHLWFDPTQDFHTYKILWNQHHIVFFVDNIPIRYFKNNKNIGVSYPSKPMKIEASIWDGSSWASDGGKTKIIWSHAPFRAYFMGFNIDGCPISNTRASIEPCNSSNYWWNIQKYWELNYSEQKDYEIVKHHFVTYDYCNDQNRHPTPPLECSNQ